MSSRDTVSGPGSKQEAGWSIGSFYKKGLADMSRLASQTHAPQNVQMHKVVFFHGLNTYGDDDLHLGPIRLGHMHGPWERALKSRGCNVFSLVGLGMGAVVDQATKAKERLREAGWATVSHTGRYEKIHFVGHSTGGLVARVLAADPEMNGQVASVLTLGTPHHGTEAAILGLSFKHEYPWLSRLFAVAGYDAASKAKIFSGFTPEAMAKFNSFYLQLLGVRYGYALCAVARTEASWPLRPFYNRLHPRLIDSNSGSSPESDGFIHAQSQAWGHRIGTFKLDHFGNLGFFPHVSARRRGEAAFEFERLIDVAIKWMKDDCSN